MLSLALNTPTMQYLGSGNIFAKRLASKNDVNYRLCIRQYLNRTHHLYDELEIIEKASEIQWLGEQVTAENLVQMKQERLEWYNKMCYNDGKIMFCIESSDSNLACLIS